MYSRGVRHDSQLSKKQSLYFLMSLVSITYVCSTIYQLELYKEET